MKAENSVKIQFDSLSANEAFARGAAAAFLARYDPTVPQLADIKTAVSEAVTNCIVHAYPCLLYTSALTADARKVQFVGVAGTAGKTAAAGLLAAILREAAFHLSLIHI